MQFRYRLIAASMLLAGPALADSQTSATTSTNSATTQSSATVIVPRPPMMPVAAAIAIALKRVPGTVLGAERETDNGIRMWQIDVRSPSGAQTRLYLDGHSGEVLATKPR